MSDLFTLEVKRKEKTDSFNFNDLELSHHECHGGEITMSFNKSHDEWDLICKRCGCKTCVRIIAQETVAIINTAIDGKPRDIGDQYSSPHVQVIRV